MSKRLGDAIDDHESTGSGPQEFTILSYEIGKSDVLDIAILNNLMLNETCEIEKIN